MKTPANKAILYDDNCPMCALYTQGFVQWGVLQPENRVPFTQAGQQLKPENLGLHLDTFRARHEIPLIDLAGGPTLYGIDAMGYLLGQRIPLIGYLLRVKPLHRFFRFLYSLISYNRRIIVPSPSHSTAFDCTPAFHLRYRLTFVGFALVLASLITYLFGGSVTNFWPVKYSGEKMLLICGTGWLMQLCWAMIFMKEKRIDYLGHLAVVMIAGVLILIPGMVFGWLTHHRFGLVPLVSVLISSGVMLWQHIRRVGYLGLSQWWTIAWFTALQLTAAFWVYALLVHGQ